MKACVLTFAVVALFGAVYADEAPTWPLIGKEAKPWVYNWWMASAIDEPGIRYQCEQLTEKGFGGFHVIPIYGAKGYEKQYREYLSSEWLDAWNMAARMARKHGLDVDMTMGSGWCFGGPWITKEDATSSGMKVKRAGPGGQGYMIDPFSTTAMSNFIARFEAAFGKDAKGVERPRAFYHDSYEYMNARPKRDGDWDEMQQATFKVWTDWCRANGYISRNEAHGAPGNWLDLYAIADMPETEMFEKKDRDILISKFASSAAHVVGRKFVTSESCTWVDEHFTETLGEIKTFLDRLFLSGVNHMFYHGMCYSPVDVVWPGWCFYASCEMNPRNPIWHDVDLLNAYVARCQSMFQSCKPDEDTLLYWPYKDSLIANTNGVADADGRISIHNRKYWFSDLPIGMMANKLYSEGYAFDYVSDRQLQTLDLSRYSCLVVPETKTMPPETATAVARFKNGTPRVEPFSAEGFCFTRFRRGNDQVYFLVNTNATRIAKTLKPTAKGKRGWFMNPMDGSVVDAPWEDGFTVDLESCASTFLVVREGAPAQCKKDVARMAETAINGPWKLEPVVGGPEMPPMRMMESLSSWSRNADGSENSFCGTMRYSTEFNWDGADGKATLDLGVVHQSARVKINGKNVGFAIMSPYRVCFGTDVLKCGRNTLEVEVTSVGANRIRWNDMNGVNWKYFRDANMVTFGYKGQIKGETWPLRDCGLIGPVKLLYRQH